MVSRIVKWKSIYKNLNCRKYSILLIFYLHKSNFELKLLFSERIADEKRRF